MPKVLTQQRGEALLMRIEGRLSLNEIQARLGVSKASLSSWLREHPLSEEERFKKQCARTPRTSKVTHRDSSVLWSLCRDPKELSCNEKGRIAEAAILLRFALLGITPYQSSFDGGRFDYIAQLPEGCFKTFQVRWAGDNAKSSPSVSVRKSDGRRKFKKYQPGDMDFLIGYDLFDDLAYVYAWSEISTKTSCISMHPDAAEAWAKVVGPLKVRRTSE